MSRGAHSRTEAPEACDRSRLLGDLRKGSAGLH